MFTLPQQTFAWIDIPLIFILFFLELLLSSDNAVALGVLVRDLPVKKRKKALFTGLFSGILLRAAGIIMASYLIQLFWVQWVGGAYLMYVAYKHVRGLANPKHKREPESHSFWWVVCKVELVDLLFAIDSILAAFALAGFYYPFDVFPHKLWVIYIGGIIGAALMRVWTTGFIKLMESKPGLERVIFLLIGWMGLKLIVEGIFYLYPNPLVDHIFDFFFWFGALIIFLVGFLSTKWDQKV